MRFFQRQWVFRPSQRLEEGFALRARGGLVFSHPQGTHGDVFWATALAVYGTCEMSPEPYLAVVPRIARCILPYIWLQHLRRRALIEELNPFLSKRLSVDRNKVIEELSEFERAVNS